MSGLPPRPTTVISAHLIERRDEVEYVTLTFEGIGFPAGPQHITLSVGKGDTITIDWSRVITMDAGETP